jgi:MFS family permease
VPRSVRRAAVARQKARAGAVDRIGPAIRGEVTGLDPAGGGSPLLYNRALRPQRLPVTPPNAPPAPGTRIGPIEFAPGISRLNAWTYLYQSFVTVALFSFLSFAQPYVLSEVLRIPADQAGRITGALVTMQEIVGLLLVGYAGALSDRVGRRPLFALGFVLMAAGYALFPFAGGTVELFAYRFVYALGIAVSGVLFAVIAADYPAESSRGKLAGAGGLLNGLGVALAAVAFSQLPALSTAAGYSSAEAARLLLLGVAALSLATAVILHFGLKGGTPGRRRSKVTLLTTMRVGIREGLGNRRLLLCYAGGFISRADLTLVATFISLWLQQAGRNDGLSAEEAIAKAGMVFGIIQGTSLLWAPVAGLLLDRVHRLACLVAALGVAGIGYTFLGLQEHPFGPAGLAGAMLVGIGQMSVILSATALMGQETPIDSRGAVIGLAGFCGAVGILTTSVAGGFLYDHWRISGPVLFVGGANLVVFAYGLWLWFADGRPLRFDAREAARHGGGVVEVAH